MKKSSLGFVAILSITVLFVCSQKTVVASDTEYDYPIKPGTSEWAQYNHAERIELLNIDQDSLDALSTEELVDVVLRYPHFSDMYYYGNYQTGFEVMSSHFNGLQELLNREDAGEYLLQRYQTTPSPTNIEEQVSLANLEAILAQPEVRETFTNDKLEKLETTQNNNQQKNRINTSFYSNVYDKCLIEQTKNNTQDRSTSTVYTPNGTAVPVLRRGEELTSDEKAYMAQQVREAFPSASILGPATTNYNCHSYAWFSQSTSNPYWMDFPYYYWQDGSYYQNGSINVSTPPINTRTVYHWPTLQSAHSAIAMYSSGNRYVSKWGDTPLVRHSAYDNPYYYSGVSLVTYSR